MGRLAAEPPERGRTLLVLGAGPAQLGLLETARAHGIWTAVCDRDPAAPGFAFADRRCIVSIDDESAIERLASALPLDGVIAAGNRHAGRRRGSHRREARPRPPSEAGDRDPRDEQAAPAGSARRGRRPAASLGGRRRERHLRDPAAGRREGGRPVEPRRAFARPPPGRARARPRLGPRGLEDRRRAGRGVRRRARGDGDRLLGRRRLRAARRHRPDRRGGWARRAARLRLAVGLRGDGGRGDPSRGRGARDRGGAIDDPASDQPGRARGDRGRGSARAPGTRPSWSSSSRAST